MWTTAIYLWLLGTYVIINRSQNVSFGIEFSSETTGCGFHILNICLVSLTCGLMSLVNDNHMNNNLKEILVYVFFFFFFFFDLGFTALSRIFYLYRADRSSKVGENRRTRRKTTWPSLSRTWLSHIWPERGSNHSGDFRLTINQKKNKQILRYWK